MHWKTFGPGVAAACLFIALGVLFIPLAGLQSDEALFAAPLYYHPDNNLLVNLWHHQVPAMVMTYLGSLKAFLYAPILAVFGSGIWAIRLPVVLLGAATLFIFFLLVREAEGGRAAAVGAFLLATDPVFLLTNTFDWGPVALDHFFLVTGCWLLYRFGSRREAATGLGALAGAGFCFGLALWNKAIFVWALSGLLAGGVTVFWPEVRRALAPKTLAAAAMGLLVGVSPLLMYNLRHDFVTVGQNTHLEVGSLGTKWIQFRSAANGNSLFGYMVAEEWEGSAKSPGDARGRAAAWLHGVAGERRQSGFYYLLFALLAAVPLWWRSRAARFAVVFCAVAWLAMALTRDAGGSAHHVILLWPFPVLFAAAALARIPTRIGRSLGIALAAGVVGMNLLVLNQYLYQFESMGAWDSFSDAMVPLSRAAARQEGTIYVADWGIFDSLTLLHQGRLKLRVVDLPADAGAPTEAQRAGLAQDLEDRGAIFLGHVPEREVFPGSIERLRRAAEEAGYRKEVLQIVDDGNGRPIFEMYRFVQLAG